MEVNWTTPKSTFPDNAQNICANKSVTMHWSMRVVHISPKRVSEEGGWHRQGALVGWPGTGTYCHPHGRGLHPTTAWESMLISVELQRPHNSWRLIRIWEVSVFAGCFHLRSNKARLSCLIKTMWKQMVLCTEELWRNEFSSTEGSAPSHCQLPNLQGKPCFLFLLPCHAHKCHCTFSCCVYSRLYPAVLDQWVD